MANLPKCGHHSLNPKCKDCKALQKQWYKKLEQSGFEDHENARGDLKQPDERTIAFENRDKMLYFFTKLDSWLNDVENPAKIPDKHREVLELYSQGIHIQGANGIVERVGRSDRTIRLWLKYYKQLILSLPDEETDEGL